MLETKTTFNFKKMQSGSGWLCSVLSFLSLLLFATATSADDFDIVVEDRAVVQRCVTGKNARNIAVGMPGGFNYSFDPVRGRLDYVWFGGFLDYRQEATGRGGKRVTILGAKRLAGADEIPIRIGDANKAPQSIRFEGYRKDSSTGIPTFMFTVDGCDLEQRILSFAPDQVTIELQFPESNDATRFYRTKPTEVASIEVSEKLTLHENGVIRIPASETWAQIRFNLKPSNAKFVRPEPTTNGKLLYAMHCMSCHTLDGKKKIGPSFTDLWTKNRIVTRNGRSEDVKTDREYVVESILQPQAAIVQGYENANKMVDIRQTLNEKQIEALVEFLVNLKEAN